MTEKIPSSGDRLTSQISGALWEYPPAVCGQHSTAPASLENSKRWAMISYHVYAHLAADSSLASKFGVHMRPAAFFFKKPIMEDAFQRKKVRDIMRSGVVGFRHDANIINESGVRNIIGVDGVADAKPQDAYEILSPVIDTDHAMEALLDIVKAKGANVVIEAVKGNLLDQEAELLNRFHVQAIVNATGLGARETADDKNVYPLRGAMLRLVNDGRHFSKIERALVFSAEKESRNNTSTFIFIVPRNDYILVAGGFSEPDEYKLDLTMDSPHVVNMRKRIQGFIPEINMNNLDSSYPLPQGLRPARDGDARVEREQSPPKTMTMSRYSRIVHSYGHADSGWSFSFGSALDVLALVSEVLYQQSRARMEMQTASAL